MEMLLIHIHTQRRAGFLQQTVAASIKILLCQAMLKSGLNLYSLNMRLL